MICEGMTVERERSEVGRRGLKAGQSGGGTSSDLTLAFGTLECFLGGAMNLVFDSIYGE